MATRENGYTATEQDFFWSAAKGKVDVDPSTSVRIKEETIMPEETSTFGDVQLAPLEEVLVGSGCVKTEPIEDEPWGPVASADQWDPHLLPELAVKLEVNWNEEEHLPVGTINTEEMHNLDGGQAAESAAAAPIRRRPGADPTVSQNLPLQDVPPPATTQQQQQCARCEDLYRLATPENIAFLEKLLQCMRAVSGQMPRHDTSGPATHGNHLSVGLPQGTSPTQAAKHDKTELVAGSGVLISKAVKRRLVLKHSAEPSALARALFAELVPDLKSVTAQGQRGKPAVPADVRHSIETFVTDIVETNNRSSPLRRVALPKFSEIINRKAASLRRNEKRKIFPGYGRLKGGRRADAVAAPAAAHRSPRKATRQGTPAVPGADTAPLPSPMVVSEENKLN